MRANFPQTRDFLRPLRQEAPGAKEFQQKVLVHDEMLANTGVKADTLSLPIIIRDFREAHPDFENQPWTIPGFHGSKPTLGIVQDRLGSDRKPIYKGGITVQNKESFDQWYNDVPNVNTRAELTLNLTRSRAGTLVADIPNFFPLDHLGDLHPRYHHNFWFTLEMHTAFKYHGGEKFHFRGDDDLWVFINGSLAIDLGGMHEPLSQAIELDTLGLNKGQLATLDLFFAERHTTQSNFRVETTIEIGEDLCTDYPRMQLGTVAHNNLGNRGPDSGLNGLVYRGTKFVPDEEIMDMELAVSVKDGSTYEPGITENGLFGKYGFVNLKAGTEVTLQFSFRDPDTKNPLLLSTAHVSFLDLDQAALGKSSEYVEVGGHTGKIMMPETEILEEHVADGLTRFSATTPGSALDNPRDPNLLTVQQKNRIVTLTFTDTSRVEAKLGCSAGSTECDFMFAVEPSLLCSKITGPHPVTQTVTTTTTTMIASTTTKGTQTEREYCVIDINAFNLRLICFPEKQWWMLWK